MARRSRRNRGTNKSAFYEAIGSAMRAGAGTDVMATKSSISLVLGIVALALGVSAFIPALAPGNMVWGLFEVNAVHTGIHLISGALAVYAAYRLDAATSIWRGAALFFGALTLLGLFTGQGQVLGLVANNFHDVWLHAIKTIGFAFLGWGMMEARR